MRKFVPTLILLSTLISCNVQDKSIENRLKNELEAIRAEANIPVLV